MNQQLSDYVAMVQGKVNAGHIRSLNYPDPDTVSVKLGRKYAKVIVTSADGDSVHTFINMNNGDILKAGSWAAPATNGIRGSIFAADNGASVVNKHGANYLK